MVIKAQLGSSKRNGCIMYCWLHVAVVVAVEVVVLTLLTQLPILLVKVVDVGSEYTAGNKLVELMCKMVSFNRFNNGGQCSPCI